VGANTLMNCSAPLSQDDLLGLQQQLRQTVLAILQNADPSDSQMKADGSIVTSTDHALQAALESLLAQHWPDIPLLGEEQDQHTQHQLLQSGSFWCLDPLDGTTNFSRRLPLYSVSLALIQEGRPVLGIVFDPLRDELFSALLDGPLMINGKRLNRAAPVTDIQKAIAFIDFKRLSDTLSQQLVLQPHYKSQRNIGTCALEWAWLAAGRAQLLLHGGEKLWDYAAGLVLLQAAGGRSCTLDNEAIFRPSLTPRSICAATTPDLHSQWQNYLGLNP